MATPESTPADQTAEGLSPAKPSPDAGKLSQEVLVFEVGEQTYALPASEVLELVRAVAITPLPNAPAVIKGVVDVRGSVLPVLDVRARFHLPPSPTDPSDHFIVARAGARSVVLHVDRATHLAVIDPSSLEAPETLGVKNAYIAGVVRLDGGLVFIHDVATFLSATEAAGLDDALLASAAP